MLTPYDWVYGIATLTAVFLSVIAGVIALGMFEQARQRKHLAAWKPLIIALVLFAVEETVGALKIFGVYSTTWLTHVIPSFIMLFLIAAITASLDVALTLTN